MKSLPYPTLSLTRRSTGRRWDVSVNGIVIARITILPTKLIQVDRGSLTLGQSMAIRSNLAKLNKPVVKVEVLS